MHGACKQLFLLLGLASCAGEIIFRGSSIGSSSCPYGTDVLPVQNAPQGVESSDALPVCMHFVSACSQNTHRRSPVFLRVAGSRVPHQVIVDTLHTCTMQTTLRCQQPVQLRSLLAPQPLHGLRPFVRHQSRRALARNCIVKVWLLHGRCRLYNSSFCTVWLRFSVNAVANAVLRHLQAEMETQALLAVTQQGLFFGATADMHVACPLRPRSRTHATAVLTLRS